MISEEIKNIKSGKGELKNFAIVMAAVLSILALIFWWQDRVYYKHFFMAAMAFFSLGILLPSVLKPIYKAWMVFGVILGWVMTRVILIIFYYLIITPIGLVGRLFGHKFLDKKIDREADSYWLERPPSKPTDCEKQF